MEKQALSLWKQFEKTGSIADYLHYQQRAKHHTASQHRQHTQHTQHAQYMQHTQQSEPQ